MDKGSILFRVDGSQALGLGHLMRCLALAESLRNSLEEVGEGGDIHFAVKREHAVRRILSSASSVDSIHWVEEGAEEESLKEIVRKVKPKTVITDIDLRGKVEEYLSLIYPSLSVSLHEHNYSILNGDIVVAPTVLPLPIAPQGSLGLTHFTGADYLLLSPEISEWRSRLVPPSEAPRKVFVSMGGGDPKNLTKLVLSVAETLLFSLEWHVVIPPAGEVREAEFHSGASEVLFFIHPGWKLSRSEFFELLSSADLVVTNGGTTLYESLAMGKPTVSVPQNEFEWEVAKQLGSEGVCAGVLEASEEHLSEVLMSLLEDAGKRLEMSKAGLEKIDGEGCRRVARLIRSRMGR